MTFCYYLASDQIMKPWDGPISIHLSRTNLHIPGFDVSVQFEIFNGLEEDWELEDLLQYIHHHTAPYNVCTVQIANLLNSQE